MSKISVTTIAGLTSGGDANKVKIESGDDLVVESGGIGIGTSTISTAVGGGVEIHRNGGSSFRIEDTTNSVTGELQVYSSGVNLVAQTNHPIIISPNNSEIARFSTAGLHIGGTGAANALDDYEEGTWTPTLDFNGGSTGISYSTQSARYTKIGNVVHFSFRMYLSNKGSSTGHAHVGGFPFAADAMPTGGVFQLTPARGWLGDNDEPIYLYFNSGTRMPVYQNDWDGTANAAATDSQFANNTELELTASYFTSS